MDVLKKVWQNKKDDSSRSDMMAAEKSIIGKTLFLRGEIRSDEDVEVRGKIEGNIKVKNRIFIGKDGVVSADIEAKEVVIKGTVNGNVKGSFKVEIVNEGVLNGNITSQRVVLAEGAIFKGNVDMSTKDDIELVRTE